LNDEPAQTVIAAGKGGAGTAQTCEDCHTAKGVYSLHGLSDDGGADDVSSAHDKFLAESGTATSTCSNCHTAATEQNRINLHTTTGSGSGDCLTCHQDTTDMDPGAPTVTPQDIIDAGKGTGGANQNCDSCHIAINNSWGNHSIDHATFVLEDTNCTSCHDGNPGTNTTAPNAPSGNTPYVGVTEVHNPTLCYTCHDNSAAATRGNYLTQVAANVKGYVGAMPAGSTNPTCSDCHTAYFDGHATHTASSGHTVTFDGGTLDQTDGGSPCNNCHGVDGGDVGTTVLDSWDEITALHNFNSCGTCHSYDGVTGEHNNTPAGTVASVILASGATTCADCHTEKITPNQHGDIDHTTYDGGAGAGVVKGEDDGLAGTNCVTCHDTGGLGTSDHFINTIHNASLRGCGTCHKSSTGAGELVDYSIGSGYSAASGNNGLPSLLGGAQSEINYEGINSGHGGFCSTCHNPYQTASNHAVKDHDQLGNQTECNSCHTETVGEDIRTVIHSGIGCGTCHDTTAGYIMNSGTSAANHTYGSVDSCTGCHAGATSEFDGGTTVHSTGGTETHASMLTGASNCTTTCHSGNVQTVVHNPNGACQNCHASASDGSFVTLTYGSSVNHNKGVASSCTDCHGSDDPVNYAGNFQAHTADTHSVLSTTGADKCTACHTNVNIATLAVDSDLHGDNCENCHIDATSDGSFQDGTETDSKLGATVAGNATLHTIGNSSNCLVCHNGYDSDFTSHDAATRDTRHLTYLAGSSKCTGCHSGANQCNRHRL
jgi:hypothetical protein